MERTESNEIGGEFIEKHRIQARLRRIERGAKLSCTPNKRKRTARRCLLRNGDPMCTGTKEQNGE